MGLPIFEQARCLTTFALSLNQHIDVYEIRGDTLYCLHALDYGRGISLLLKQIHGGFTTDPQEILHCTSKERFTIRSRMAQSEEEMMPLLSELESRAHPKIDINGKRCFVYTEPEAQALLYDTEKEEVIRFTQLESGQVKDGLILHSEGGLEKVMGKITVDIITVDFTALHQILGFFGHMSAWGYEALRR